MLRPLHWCVYLPVTLLASLCSDAQIISNRVCIGESVHVFQNITSPSFSRGFELYQTFADNHEVIFVMEFRPGVMVPYRINPKYDQRLSLENGTILIRDFQTSDDGIYVILDYYRSERKEVQICANVPPSKHCKPIIKLVDTRLFASVLSQDCGKPNPSVYFLGYNNQNVIALLPEEEQGEYHACLDGPSLRCAKGSKLSDYCSSFRVRAKDIHQTTWSTDQDQDIEATGQNIPTIDYLVYVISGVAVIGLVVSVVFCFQKKYSHCHDVVGVSTINQTAHSDTGDSKQEETLYQHYWTIGTNTRGELSTILERDINVELVEFIDNSHTDIMQSEESINASHQIPQEDDAYLHPLNSDPTGMPTSNSDSVEESIDCITSNPMRVNTYLDLLPSDAMECNECTQPFPSDPVDLGGYIEPIPSDAIRCNDYFDIIPSDAVERNEYIDPIPSDSVDIDGYIDPIPSDPMRRNEYIDLIPSDVVECIDYIHPIPSDSVDLARSIEHPLSDPTRLDASLDLNPSDPVECSQYMYHIPSDHVDLDGHADPTPSKPRGGNRPVD